MFKIKKSQPTPSNTNKGMNEELEMACFMIISHAGTARSQFIMAIDAAEKGDFARAEELMKAGTEEYTISNRSHHEIVQMEESGVLREPHLLLVHCEDQMMSAEAFKVMAEKFISLYREVKALKEA
ncbi:MAG: PTS lactose/cellobiose transporter subunit IIA [Lachnospiraceae bacterium]|nr:PTS lactose/cellobiose transporter subunit IIA [Lachnospiraceae bacterium]